MKPLRLIWLASTILTISTATRTTQIPVFKEFQATETIVQAEPQQQIDYLKALITFINANKIITRYKVLNWNAPENTLTISALFFNKNIIDTNICDYIVIDQNNFALNTRTLASYKRTIQPKKLVARLITEFNTLLDIKPTRIVEEPTKQLQNPPIPNPINSLETHQNISDFTDQNPIALQTNTPKNNIILTTMFNKYTASLALITASYVIKVPKTFIYSTGFGPGPVSHYTVTKYVRLGSLILESIAHHPLISALSSLCLVSGVCLYTAYKKDWFKNLCSINLDGLTLE
jgi:hypothetical protein